MGSTIALDSLPVRVNPPPMGHDELIDRPDAVERVLRLRAELPTELTETVPLSAIDGRTLAESIQAPATQPAQSHATMDGYAFDATKGYPYDVVSEIYPEDEPPSIDPGEAVEIATGAPLPREANAVLKREEATVTGGELEGSPIEPGTYAYERGSNVEAGETVFAAGERLSPRDAILLRDLGRTEVRVRSPLSVGILATGTEIHEGRSADLDSPMLAGLVQRWGHAANQVGSVPDEYEQVRDRIAEVAASQDVVLTTGGTSVGHKDYVIRALADLGDLHFHGVRIRPGKPIAVATLADHDATAFAIPGKPVGAYTITTAVARPFFTGSTTLPGVRATFRRDVDVPTSGFEYWIPVTLEAPAETPNRSGAMPLGHVDSPLSVYDGTFDPSVLSSSTRATRSDGVVITESGLTRGDDVTVHPWDALQ